MKAKLLFLAAVFASILGGCGDHEHIVTGPGFVGIDDSTVDSAPRLNVTYTDPSTGRHNVDILSDPQSDGDIAFNPVLNTFTVASAVPAVFFGVDSLNGNLPEFRSFLTFPLDGITRQPVIPGTATIDSAFVEVLVDEVSFASVVPTFLDLVEYPFRGLRELDFDSAPVDFQTLDFFSSDPGIFVQIDVTPLMREAQSMTLLDFQVRFSLDTTVLGPLSTAPAATAGRTVHSGRRALDNILSNRGGGSSTTTLTQKDLASRHR